ncbi:MAG: SHOCT domain-containing protein [Candidatus Brocadia sp. AMX2]|nr:MAG: SHOCT domain-containing protein [Candidatus Brocadia sp. AMX2]KXK29710.1 MAG: hypothetical protein UZ01_02086 [Candidatus Brocadia sinica]MBC6931804.1 SHOCT domain-containing protein [Candidatus Brocadia sp.]MBL1167341.1 SHOCT domain-containing protein [Candidatus Brocadia sp. AMX1]MCE7865278.1 SHOCT domain-containing protein [Candidatus Brocadia sp. AMX2]
MNFVRNQRLKHTLLFMGIVCMMFFCKFYDAYADTYTDGRIIVKHEELPVKKNGRHIQFDHPYEVAGNVITNALSYIYFEEKGLLKKKGTLRVFQDDEIRKLVPLIVQALSVATPTQVVTVSSYSERILLTDQQNYCAIFISDRNLNIAFSRIHMFQSYNDAMSEKKRYTTAKENPSRISHSRFWKLVPSAGQRLEPSHENWLVIDLSNEMYQQPVAQRVGTVDEKIKMGTSELDARLKKLEERMVAADETKVNKPITSVRENGSESKIKSKLVILREMMEDEIISEEDYDYKKVKMLREAMGDMSIKEQLQVIKDLKIEGLITEDDYNEKKKELLDQF